MNCDCEKYEHLEFYREAIDKRIKETKKLKKNLELLATQKDGGSNLLKCSFCNQFWQSSRAWNWGAKEYCYKVPQIEIYDWLEEPFAKPDEMLIYTAVLTNYEEGQTFNERPEKCRLEGCDSQAIELSVFCKWHHIESLQNARALPKRPQGRFFEPYS